MKPNEFYNCTYKEAKEFVEYNSLQRKNELKNNIQLLEGMADKIISATKWNKPKYISLVKNIFKDLFEEFKEGNNQNQSLQDQIRILRSWNKGN